MAYYRLHLMDARERHIIEFREFEADDDERAIDAAENWSTSGSMELWDRARLVKQWLPSEPSLETNPHYLHGTETSAGSA
jgi:hypothetical protein